MTRAMLVFVLVSALSAAFSIHRGKSLEAMLNLLAITGLFLAAATCVRATRRAIWSEAAARQAHNQYLGLLAERGVLGLAALAVLTALSFGAAATAMASGTPAMGRVLVAGLAGSVAALLTFGTNEKLENRRPLVAKVVIERR